MSLLNSVSYEEEKKKNPELTDTDIQSLREWLKKQPHLPKMEDNEIALFLHSNYYKIEPTKSTIETFYTIRTHVPEFFANRDPLSAKDFKKITQCVANIPLKGRTKEGYHILYSALLDLDTSKYDYTAHMKLLTMIGDVMVKECGTYKGHISVIELRGLAMGHLSSFSPVALKKFFTYLQEGTPMRLMGIHFVHVNPVMDLMMNMMKPFMKKELQETNHLHQTTKTLEKFLDIDVLPEESGGKAGKSKDLFAEVMRKVEANRQWFMDLEKLTKVDESKRIGPAKNSGELFGVEGNFKKLAID